MRNARREKKSDHRSNREGGGRVWWRASLFALLFVVALGITALSQLYLPSYVQNALQEGIGDSLDEYDALNVRLSTVPALELLTGRVDAIEIEARGLRSGNLRIEGFSIDGSQLRIGIWDLLQRGRLEIESASSLDATLSITEEDLNRYYWAEVDPNRALSVRLEEGAVSLQGSLNVLGQAMTIDVSGHFEVRGPTSVAFIPEKLSVQEAEIPEFLVAALLKDWELVLKLGDLPIDLAIDQIRIEDGHARLHAVYAG